MMIAAKLASGMKLNHGVNTPRASRTTPPSGWKHEMNNSISVMDRCLVQGFLRRLEASYLNSHWVCVLSQPLWSENQLVLLQL